MRTNRLLQHDVAANDGVATSIRKVIAEQLGVAAERVTAESRFLEDLGADWLDRLELMLAVEDQFDCTEIQDDDIDKMESVGDLIRFIESHLAA